MNSTEETTENYAPEGLFEDPFLETLKQIFKKINSGWSNIWENGTQDVFTDYSRNKTAK